MESNWDFDAPTFVDFGNDQHEDVEKDGADDYFNYDHEASKSAGLKTTGVFEPHLMAADVQNNNRQTFETPKHIRSALVSAQNESASFSPQCTVGNVVAQSKIQPSNEVHESSNVAESHPPIGRPLDSLEESSDVCDAAQDVAVDSLDEAFEKKPLESASNDAGCVASEIHCTKIEDDTAVFKNREETSLNLQDIVTTSGSEELGQQQMLATTAVKMEVVGDVEMCNVEAVQPVTSEPQPKKEALPNLLKSWQHSSKQRSAATTPLCLQRRSDRREKLKEWRRDGKPKSAEHGSNQPPIKMKKSLQLSMPHTPMVLKHEKYASTSHAKSREERELEEIELAKHMQEQRLRESSKSFKVAMKGPSPRPETPSKRTKVKEFKFATDDRIKATHSMETRSSRQLFDKDFAKGLRQHPASPKKLGKTVPKPFNLSENRKRKLEQGSTSKQGYSFKPLAKAVTEFRNLRSAGTGAETDIKKGPIKAKRNILTIAKTPKLETKSRKRALNIVGDKEKEDQEVEEMKRHQFKAKSVNRAILQKPDALPSVERLPSTNVEEFHLHIGKRVEHEKSPSPTREFKARPVPKAVIQGPSQIMKADPATMTVPQSPAFVLKHRMALAHMRKESQAKAKEKKEELKPKPIVPLSKRGKAEPSEKKKIVSVEPFSFDDRNAKMLAEKERKIKEIHDAERAAASAFRATPMMFDVDGPTDVPLKEVRPNTKIEPFHLASEERGAVKSGNFKLDLENECRVLREKTHIIANTNYKKSLYGEGFKPVVAKKCTDTFDEFLLHTNSRASQRREFDERQKEAEAAAIKASEERLRIAAELEELERQKSRKLAEHKAAPIRHYKDLLINSSTRELTEPQSPNFSDRFYGKRPSSAKE